MADRTPIEWTDATWNPITGCSVVSPGCTNCYAMKLAGTRLKHHPSRAGLTKDTKTGPVWTGEVRFNREWLHQPLTWAKPRMIFVCAHGDLFAEGVPDGWIMRVFSVMAQCPQHTFQVLTKRPERMRDFFRRWADLTGEDFGDFKEARGPAEVRANHPSPRGQLFADMLESMGTPPAGAAYPTFDWMGGMINWPDVFPNIWLGVSTEDQVHYNERWPHMEELQADGWLTWISAEPLIAELSINYVPLKRVGADGKIARYRKPQWVVVGGESGRGARPMRPEWAESLRDQCASAGVPFLFKQWGNHKPTSDCNGRYMIPATKKEAGRLLDGIEHNAFPEVRR
ncbi:phage Gp37/Gp68 family protein [Rhizobiaceae bacterium n13]|uniref:DUF5131 family protein n=1 Tax=Ferirhizobium litorale TaxID=2927786 RepID=UPI0024B2ECCC|nr:phage Gp37/Gp68 family protein [Fererhizobium litorale]MDI7864335.1 phage Gp37/Gp68 family protein [Fererhizobium litorale]